MSTFSFNSLNIVSDFKMFEVARDEISYIMNNLNDPELLSFYKKVKDRMNENKEDIKLFD